MSRLTIRSLIVPALAAFAVVALTPAAALSSADPVASAASGVVSRPCFGAPARNPLAPCADPALRLTVFPAPDDAVLQPNAPCEPQARVDLIFPCLFGASSSTKPPTVALIGDSHASHWRAAVDVVARAGGTRAISITRTGCPFSTAHVVIPARELEGPCQSWNREVLTWLGRHSEVKTIFVSERARAQFVASRPDRSNFDTAVRGYSAMWRALPATVTSIIVVRDTPLDSAVAQDCVRRMYALAKPVGIRCARSRSLALPPDPAVAAARQLRGRVHVLDMTPFFCGSAKCYPVVGGALVHKDEDHITTVFARTIGPFMVGKVANIVKAAAAAGPV